MTNIKIAYRVPTGKVFDGSPVFDCFVIYAAANNFAMIDGAYSIVGEPRVLCGLRDIRGDINSKQRLAKVARQLGAIHLSDTENIKNWMSGSDHKGSTKKTKSTTSVSGYRLRSFHPRWGYVDGKERWYIVGVTPNLECVNNVAETWRKQGYMTKITELTNRKNKVEEDIIYEPSEPIVSLIPNDPWVGDHLASHLRKMGMSLQVYRDTFDYTGPAVVNKAAKALKRAHNTIRRKSAVSVGAILVEVKGDLDAVCWRVINIIEDDIIIAKADGQNYGTDMIKRTLNLEQIKNNYLPVNCWPKIKD